MLVTEKKNSREQSTHHDHNISKFLKSFAIRTDLCSYRRSPNCDPNGRTLDHQCYTPPPPFAVGNISDTTRRTLADSSGANSHNIDIVDIVGNTNDCTNRNCSPKLLKITNFHVN